MWELVQSGWASTQTTRKSLQTFFTPVTVAAPIEWSPPTVSSKSQDLFAAMFSTWAWSRPSRGPKMLRSRTANQTGGCRPASPQSLTSPQSTTCVPQFFCIILKTPDSLISFGPFWTPAIGCPSLIAAPRQASRLTIVCLADIPLLNNVIIKYQAWNLINVWNSLIFITFIHSLSSLMKQQQQAPHNKPRKTLSVIVLTYNRETPRSEKQSIQNDKSLVDFRSSAFKETEVDPLEFPKNEFNSIRDDELIAELNRRINDLESRVQVLETKENMLDPANSKTHRIRKHKVRRHNWQMKRDKVCIHCGKCYGTNTALKYHLKLKHQEEGKKEKEEKEEKEGKEEKEEKEGNEEIQ